MAESQSVPLPAQAQSLRPCAARWQASVPAWLPSRLAN